MKKPTKQKLVVGREVVKVLTTSRLQKVDGGLRNCHSAEDGCPSTDPICHILTN